MQLRRERRRWRTRYPARRCAAPHIGVTIMATKVENGMRLECKQPFHTQRTRSPALRGAAPRWPHTWRCVGRTQSPPRSVAPTAGSGLRILAQEHVNDDDKISWVYARRTRSPLRSASPTAGWGLRMCRQCCADSRLGAARMQEPRSFLRAGSIQDRWRCLYEAGCGCRRCCADSRLGAGCVHKCSAVWHSTSSSKCLGGMQTDQPHRPPEAESRPGLKV